MVLNKKTGKEKAKKTIVKKAETKKTAVKKSVTNKPETKKKAVKKPVTKKKTVKNKVDNEVVKTKKRKTKKNNSINEIINNIVNEIKTMLCFWPVDFVELEKCLKDCLKQYQIKSNQEKYYIDLDFIKETIKYCTIRKAVLIKQNKKLLNQKDMD